MIPKIIHYCWFGGNPLPELAQKCIASWKKYCPDYELMLWNESNFDVNTVPFTAQVAKAKKWGFIVDYIRAYVVYNYGGIYLDVDVELLKSFDNDMLQNKCFSGFELAGFNYEVFVAPGLVFAGEKGCEIAKELMDFYSKYHFIKENGELNLIVSPIIFTDILLKYGLKRENIYQNLGIFTVYPTEYFAPKLASTGLTKITNNTVSIHHYDGSWVPVNEMKRLKKIHRVYSIFGDNILSKFFVFCGNILSNFAERFFVKLGPVGTFKYYWEKIIRKDDLEKERL